MPVVDSVLVGVTLGDALSVVVREDVGEPLGVPVADVV